MALTDYDKKNLSKDDQKKIQAATDKWNAANASGDKAGMASAAAEAAAVRNNAGYKTDSSGYYTGGYSNGGNSQYTGSKGYTIGSDKGKNIAQNMGIGQAYTASDGSVWRKENDGTITVNHGGKMYQNAYTPSDYSILINQQLAAGVPYQDVMNSMYARLGKASSDPELNKYMYDDVYNMAWNYIMENQGKENIDASMADMQNYMNDFEANNPRPDEHQTDPRIEKLLNEILTREDFSYNAMNDPLYQQYRDMYQREGDRAMRNTLAEAAAGAGGMNTYAMTAAIQANNYYNSQLNDKIPELYQLAYNMYLDDKASKVQDLGLLQQMDATQYNRYRDTMADWYGDKNFAYGTYLDAVNQGNWLTNYNTNAMVDNRNWTNENYWANKEWDYNDAWKNKEWDYNDAWKNKEWDAYLDEVNYGKAQDNYNKDIYDKETATNEVWRLINLGIVPSEELINRAGLDKTDVANAARVIQEELDKLGVSTKSSGTSSSSSNKTNTSSSSSSSSSNNGYTGSTSSSNKTNTSSSSSSSSSNNSTSNSNKSTQQKETDAMRSVANDLGISIMTNPSRVVALYEVGAIYDDKNGKTHWKDGWNATNFNAKLNDLGR